MILSNLSPRERRIALSAVLITLSCLLFNFYIYPQIKSWKRIARERKVLDIELLKVERTLKLRERIEKEYTEYQEQILTQVSDEEEIAELLREIERRCRPIGLYILSIKPLPITDRGFYKRYAVQLEAEGEMPTLAKFLYSLWTSPKLLKVERLEINARSGTKLLRSNLLITRVLAIPEGT